MDVKDNNIEVTTFNDVYELLENYDTIKKLNKSKPILNKYEKTKVLGIRAEQIRHGSKPLITVPSYMTDELDIASEELKQRKIMLPSCFLLLMRINVKEKE